MANKVTTKKESAYLCSDEFATSISFSKFIKIPQLPPGRPLFANLQKHNQRFAPLHGLFSTINCNIILLLHKSFRSVDHLIKVLQSYWDPTYSWQSLDVRDDRGLNSLHYFLITDGNINPIQASFIPKYAKFALEHRIYLEKKNNFYKSIRKPWKPASLLAMLI